MFKYRVTIEFTTNKALNFPADARLLSDMQAQLESIDDGTYDDMISGVCAISKYGKIAVVSEICDVCSDVYCAGCGPEQFKFKCPECKTPTVDNDYCSYRCMKAAT